MDGPRWVRIQELFHASANLPRSAERLSFLELSCGDDQDLKAEVLAMLEEDDRASSILDGGIAQVADRMLDQTIQPKEFGRYRIKELLGEGGMAVVYLAE